MEKKKVFEHIFYFLLTVCLTYLSASIPFVRDTHRFVKSEIEISKFCHRINAQQEVFYEISNKGALTLDESNTIIEYKSNSLPQNAIIIDETGRCEKIPMDNRIPEPFRITYPNWLKSRDNFSLKIIYATATEVNDEVIIRFSRDGKYSKISSSKDNSIFKDNLKDKLYYLLYTSLFLIFVFIFILVHWIKNLIPKIRDYYYKKLEEKFISNNPTFLRDENDNN